MRRMPSSRVPMVPRPSFTVTSQRSSIPGAHSLLRTQVMNAPSFTQPGFSTTTRTESVQVATMSEPRTTSPTLSQVFTGTLSSSLIFRA